MPPRRRIRSRVARARRRKVRRTRFPRRRRRTTTLIVPDKKFVKLRYISTTGTTLGGELLSAQYKNFRINSAYDVDVAIGNVEIPGFVQWSAFYETYLVHYAVVHADITCIVQPVLANTSDLSVAPSYIVGIYARPEESVNISGWGDFYRLKGNPWSVQKSVASCQGMNRVRLKLVVPMKKILGNAKSYQAERDFQGRCGPLGTGGNPGRSVHAYVYVISSDGTVFGTDYVVSTRVTITQYVQFFNRKTVF